MSYSGVSSSTGDLSSYVANSCQAKIDKLSILGVRSFDNTRSETIQFHTPLTLIVGYNGSGKTTIIECLKYATTGDLPPNSKGGAFIHDPKLCGEKEVLAQVKLSFKSMSGARMVATRSLQLTVKKTTRQQKTLEGQLLMVKDGERTSISSRVAELDQIMPQYLGVSKAVLDSVIFCHQDESLWPMSEPSVLKKKFDEIFEALKYTKAIDNIKALRKKQNEELSKFKIMEQHCKENKDKADRAEKRSIKLQEEIEALRAESHELSQQMRRAAELADKAWKESESYARILGILEGKRIEAKSIQSSIDNLQQHLVEIDESDEWLERTLEQFESQQAHYREQEESLKEKYMDLKQVIEDNRTRLGLKQAEYGKHENDKAQFERQLRRREKLIKEIARQNNIRGFDDDLDDMQVNDFMQRIRKLSKDLNQALERTRREAQMELREGQNLLNQLSQRKSALQEVKNAARKQISSNDIEADSYQRRLNEIDIDEGTKAVLESRIEETERSLHEAKEKAKAASWDNTIQSKTAEIRLLEDESSKLNAELIEGTKRAGDLARLDHLKKELKDRERSLETMKGAHSDRIKKFLTQEWNPSTLDQEYQTALQETTNALTRVERDRDGVSRELEHAEFKLKTTRKDLQQRRNELKQCVQKIRDVVDDEPAEYPDILKQRQVQLDMAKKDADQYAGLGEYLSKCMDAARQKKVCRMCSRPFKTEGEFQVFLNKLDALVKRATQDAEDESMQQLEEDLEAAQSVSTFYDTWVRLSSTEIPALEKEESQLESQRENLLSQIEDHDKIVSERAESKKNVESLSKTVATISKYHSEITTLRSQIEDLSANQQDVSGSRTLEDIQEQISAIGLKYRELQKVISKLNNDKDQSRTEITTLELKLRDVRSNLDNANYQLEKKASYAARVEEYRNLNAKERERIEKADQDIESLVPEVSKAQARYDDISSRAEARERELQQEASQLSDSLHQLDLANEEITSYNERGGPAQLTKCESEVRSIEMEIVNLEKEQGSITKDINAISTRLMDSENTKRQYADNLRYRRETAALDDVNATIEELAAQNAEVDRGRFREESERRTREHNALSARQASKMGEMKSKDDQLMQLLADWNTDYKDAAVKFKEAHIKVETTKAAVDDLGRYGSALDKAIMKYHSLKMEEINRIIEELWQKTYRGTDVDTILIRSDNENAKGNRSYNYRVCMVKQDAEMDMRGRCSAGQKVLASIIIRLALAECFGVNCGLIALDEPTTNLDRDNIRSLAESLHDIIKSRQQQSNFQLIVITHDEEFLRHMQCGDFCDYYYRVSRNERQKSIIERQSIAAVSIFSWDPLPL
ncbi:DNA repair protein RAD50 [[Emmonsia] crescens]|uniref:DNA repair protein RAD50 n=1 Tax=[Emmonsia] crescens TaxID=73230 RepID=A0A0G2J1R2_9EURO|nr:DNA repair protein RAD50 [Emmonsia crescens UAMH 3008]